MRVLLLSPGGRLAQLQRLPIAGQMANALGAQLQVACPASEAALWKLIPAVEKVLPFAFDDSVNLADWANLLGSVREPDFEVCLNFASGWAINLLISFSRIPRRVARGGFSCTDPIAAGTSDNAFLMPLGLESDAKKFRLSLPAAALEQAKAQQPAGSGPLLLLAPSGDESNDWPSDQWQKLQQTVQQKLSDSRTEWLRAGNPLQQAAQVASADGVVSSSAVASALGHYSGISVIELDALSEGKGIKQLPLQRVLQALGLS